MDYAIQDNSNKFENILVNALKIPGVKVDRNTFLYETLSKSIRNLDTVKIAISKNPIEAGISVSQID